MWIGIFSLLLVLAGALGFGRLSPRRRITTTVMGLGALNAVVVVAVLAGLVLLSLGFPLPLPAAPLQEAQAQGLTGGVAIGAALATGLAAIGAGIAVGIAGAAAIGAVAEKPEMLGRTLIFVGLAEGIAIYGLIVSFMILTG